MLCLCSLILIIIFWLLENYQVPFGQSGLLRAWVRLGPMPMMWLIVGYLTKAGKNLEANWFPPEHEILKTRGFKCCHRCGWEGRDITGMMQR